MVDGFTKGMLFLGVILYFQSIMISSRNDCLKAGTEGIGVDSSLHIEKS